MQCRPPPLRRLDKRCRWPTQLWFLDGTTSSFADFSGANLSGAALTFPSFTAADLSGTNLSDADANFGAIVGSNLRGAGGLDA